MLTQINGLHHVTSLASGARATDAFFTRVLGLRRVKKTVNFDAPEVYHLYYGDAVGTPGSVMTYFPFPGAARGRPGTGEVATTLFAVPEGALPWWRERLAAHGVPGLAEETVLGEKRLAFAGPDGDGFALAEVPGDARVPWESHGVDADHAIRGFRGVRLRLAETGPTEELLRFMNHAERDRAGGLVRLGVPGGNGADIVELEAAPGAPEARQGAGSVHHIAFSVDDGERQREVREALADAGHSVTPAIDRDYFWAIYFRSPGGVLFEVATDAPGFERDEDRARLGEALKLPSQHAHLRERLEEKVLEPLDD